MTLLEKITRWLSDSDTAHNIIHGDASTTVTTDNGPVRSLSKLVADNQAAISAAVANAGGDISLMTFTPTGGVARPANKKLDDYIAMMDVMSSGQIADTQAATQSADLSTVLQQMIDSKKSQRFKTVGTTSIRSGCRVIELDPGVYTYSTGLLVDGDLVLRCRGGHSSAILHYTGSGTAITVNSSNGAIDAPQNTRVFATEGVSLYAPSAAKGIYFGGATQRHVEMKKGQIVGVPGIGLDTGEGVYFLRLGNFEIREGGTGAYIGHYCDLFTADDRCYFGGNSGPDLVLACPTFRVDNCDFEGAKGGNCHIRVVQKTSVPASVRAGLILGNRFGPEGATPAPYDIEISDDGVVTSAEVTSDLRIWGNIHFSKTTATQKTAPLNIASKTKRLDIRGNRYSTGYTAGKYAVSSDVSKVYATGYVADSRIDGLMESGEEIRGIFCASEDHKYARAWTTGTTVTAATVVRRVGSWSGADRGAFEAPTVASLVASVSGTNYEDALGISMYNQTTASRPVWIATNGAIIDTTLDTTGSSIGAPIYIQASGGLGLTPASVPFVVARVHTVGTNAKVLVSIENKSICVTAVNADVTAKGFDRQTIIYNSAITADRTVTLNTTTASVGDVLRVTRTALATGAFNVIVNGRNIAAGNMVELTYTSTGWIFTASGAA